MEKNIVITIARQYGSGGRTVGKMLAEKLGVSFYDKQIIQMASDESGIDVKLFGQVEEGSSVKASLFNKTGLYKGDLIAPDQKGFVSDENIFNYQAKIIKEVAAEESCVIIGRCADYALADYPNVVSVFITANEDVKIRTLMERHKISESQAKDVMIKTDKKRSSYYNYYSSKRWGDSKSYDLCMNSSKIGYDGVVKMIQDFVEIKKGYKK